MYLLIMMTMMRISHMMYKLTNFFPQVKIKYFRTMEENSSGKIKHSGYNNHMLEERNAEKIQQQN